MPVIKVTDATTEPITTAQAKLWARVDIADDDTLFSGFCIPAARQDAEQRMNRTIIATTWKLLLDDFPCGREIALPYPFLSSVTHVKYYDQDGVQQTWASSNYLLDTASEPGEISLAPTVFAWPIVQPYRENAVEIQYVAGWADAAAVPAIIKQWIAMRAATLYEHREQIALGVAVSEIPFVNSLLDPYTVWDR